MAAVTLPEAAREDAIERLGERGAGGRRDHHHLVQTHGAPVVYAFLNRASATNYESATEEQVRGSQWRRTDTHVRLRSSTCGKGHEQATAHVTINTPDKVKH